MKLTFKVTLEVLDWIKSSGIEVDEGIDVRRTHI
jgi:hypothetical protein